MSSGLRASLFTEETTVGNDADIVRQALALPFVHEPGTWFEYGQRPVDLLIHVIEGAVGRDIQEFAQAELFGPIGIERHRWSWLRDRTGHTYGHAFLAMPAVDFARLGLLLGAGGSWNGRSIIASGYLPQMGTHSSTNGCYGLLAWVNDGVPCVTTVATERRVLDRVFVGSAPSDMYAMVGAGQQNNFVVPSLDLVVLWYGAFGDRDPDPQTASGANPGGDLFHNFFRILMRGVLDRNIPDPGPYPSEAPDHGLTPMATSDPAVSLGGLGFGPYAPDGCTVLACHGQDASRGPRENVTSVTRTGVGLATHPSA